MSPCHLFLAAAIVMASPRFVIAADAAKGRELVDTLQQATRESKRKEITSLLERARACWSRKAPTSM